MTFTWLYMTAAAIGGAGMLLHELKKQKEEQAADAKKSPNKRKRRELPLVSTSSAAASIPQHELQQLQAFLQKVYRWRGWQGGAYHVTQAWHAAETAAATATARSWEQDFDQRQMTDANCNALLCVTDEAFFGNRLLKYLAAKHKRNQQQQHGQADCSLAGASHNSSGSGTAGSTGSSTGIGCSSGSSTVNSTVSGNPAGDSLSNAGATGASCTTDVLHNGRCSTTGSTGAVLQSSSTADASSTTSNNSCSSSSNSNSSSSKMSGKVTCKVVEWYGPTDTWLAYFDVSNVIFINSWRWSWKHITPEHPLNVEGVVCTNRLQMLLHTLAHELVHAVVFHVFPEMDKLSPAYLENDRHGPIFQLLNKQLFGHSSDALERVQLLEAHR